MLQRSEENRPATDRLKSLPKGYISAIGIDLMIDGLVIALGFSAGAKQGKLLSIALALEMVSLGLALISELLERQLPRLAAFAITAGVSCLLIVGCALGTIIMKHLSPSFFTAALGFGVAALLFLVTEELLREAHKEEETALATVVFFVGFLSILVLDMANSSLN
jgi:ZIP family zinc transporter